VATCFMAVHVGAILQLDSLPSYNCPVEDTRRGKEVFLHYGYMGWAEWNRLSDNTERSAKINSYEPAG